MEVLINWVTSKWIYLLASCFLLVIYYVLGSSRVPPNLRRVFVGITLLVAVLIYCYRIAAGIQPWRIYELIMVLPVGLSGLVFVVAAYRPEFQDSSLEHLAKMVLGVITFSYVVGGVSVLGSVVFVVILIGLIAITFRHRTA
jgi:hypothetical protein